MKFASLVLVSLFATGCASKSQLPQPIELQVAVPTQTPKEAVVEYCENSGIPVSRCEFEFSLAQQCLKKRPSLPQSPKNMITYVQRGMRYSFPAGSEYSKEAGDCPPVGTYAAWQPNLVITITE